MYRTLIVDDEPLMRKYLEANLSEICPDFYVTGIACDGLEATELLQKQNFDLVITDIKMPEMDGLHLAKHILSSAPDTKVIIISGYSEFEYARSALKFGVSDYLLKPLSDDSIQETLSSIKRELEDLASRKNAMISSRNYNNYTDQEVKSSLLSALIRSDASAIQLFYNLLQDRNMVLMKAYSSILLLCFDELHLLLKEKKISELTTYPLELYQQCQTYCNQHNYTLARDENGFTFILLTEDDKDTLPVIAHTIYDNIQAFWSGKQLKITTSYGYYVTDMINLRGSYRSAAEATALNLKNIPSPISSNYYVSQSKFLNQLNTFCNALYTDYVSQNTDKVLTDLYLYITLFEKEISIAAILMYGTYLIRYLGKKCNIKTDYILTAFKELLHFIDDNLQVNLFERENIHTLFLQVMRVLEHGDLYIPVLETTKIIESAKEFIYTHYREPISLAIVADTLKVNPSYLSDLFHKCTGEPYTKFLTRIRMEQSLLLLKSNPNEKIYTIAEKTGFVSSKHFNSVFKKYYGCTPTEYISNNLFH